MSTHRTWLITGCSSGFGRMLAERAVALGDVVVATARSIQSLREIGHDAGDRFLALPLDVSNPDTIHQAVERTVSRFGAVDVLVNNAGYGYFSTQEDADIDEVEAMFDTNVFGLIRTTQAVLPHMRTRGSGTIVNISSVAGRIATPRGGFYQASKWAVEAISEALYLETAGLGLRVVVIEPGSYETDFAARSARVSKAERTATSPYAQQREQWAENARERLFPERQDPAEVIDAIIDAVDSQLGFVRLPVGRDATQLIGKRDSMPATEFLEWIRGRYEG